MLSLAPGIIDVPDTCASALEIPSLPYSVTLNGRNLADDFSGVGSSCDEYVCCQRELVFSITDSCDGFAADWENCETTCCNILGNMSEELRGNCLHYGGSPSCGGTDLPVSCCQIPGLPQFAYVWAEGCGQPTAGGIQRTPLDPSFCDHVCCEGHGYQKRGNCENFGLQSLPWPPRASCGGGAVEVGVDAGDAVLRYTAPEDGILEAFASGAWGSDASVYGFRGDCVEGAEQTCDASLATGRHIQLALQAGETGTIIVDGWTPEVTFQNVTVSLSWLDDLPINGACDGAEEIASLPFHDVSGLTDAGNDMAVVDGARCNGVTHVTNGYDVFYHYVPSGPEDLPIGLPVSSFSAILYVLDACPDTVPVVDSTF